MLRPTLWVFCAASLAAPLAAAAQSLVSYPPADRGASRASATRAQAVRAAQAPVLDGRFDDPVWRSAQVIDGFLEYEPNEGAETRFRTEARVAFDDHNLYVLVVMHDPAPDSIVSLLARRDVRVNSEQLKLVIDSYHDRRTAFQFAVNPAGVKRDFYVSNDVNEDPSWDAVWDVATAIDPELGWVAEFRIPFSQLRFPAREEHTFGLMIVRDVARTGARISWPLYRRSTPGYVSQAGEVGGIRGIATPRRLEIMPYAVTKNVTVDDGSRFAHEQQVTGGADLKYGVSSGLTLDATINPDFGQVEADPAVLNLTAFETFFNEQRPFFLEGAGIFRVECGDIDRNCPELFYSRRIGRAPQLGTADGYSDPRNPTATTILGAAKLTGQLGRGLSIGVMDAITQREEGAGGRTIEPAANYLVMRLRQELDGGNTGLGLMATSVRRDLDRWTEDDLRATARTIGLEARRWFFKKQYEIAAFSSVTRVEGDADAIASTQQSSVHYYQRPDDGITYDPTRTSLEGNGSKFVVSKLGGGSTRFSTVYERYSPGFEINDLGFHSRSDEQRTWLWFALQLNKPALFYRRANLNFNQGNYWTVANGTPTEIWFNFNWHVELKNMMWLHLGANSSNPFGEYYNVRQSRGGPAVRSSHGYERWGGIEGDRRNHLIPYFFFGRWTGDAGNSSVWWLEPSVDLRASSRFSASLGGMYQSAVRDAQWYENATDGGGTTHYTFANLDQTTVSLTSRLNFTATPTLSLQLYAQPFISNGRYTDWRELDQPRAERYDDRFKPYLFDHDENPATPDALGDPGKFSSKQFNLNTVLRWEYRPGSTLFLVWTQGRGIYDDSPAVNPDFRARRDYGDLFELHPDNTFLIKASYWFSY
jgi:hypothetical protein